MCTIWTDMDLQSLRFAKFFSFTRAQVFVMKLKWSERRKGRGRIKKPEKQQQEHCIEERKEKEIW